MLLPLCPAVFAATDVPVPTPDVHQGESPAGAKDFPGIGAFRDRYWERHRARQPALEKRSLDEKVVVHTDSEDVNTLIQFLLPKTWSVRYDIDSTDLDQKMVFHAETTRKRALETLCARLGLKGIFYPRRRLVLIVEEARW